MKPTLKLLILIDFRAVIENKIPKTLFKNQCLVIKNIITGMLQIKVVRRLAYVISKSVKSRYFFKNWYGLIRLIDTFIDSGNLKYDNSMLDVEIIVAKQNCNVIKWLIRSLSTNL
jgi:hypothetical protein